MVQNLDAGAFQLFLFLYALARLMVRGCSCINLIMTSPDFDTIKQKMNQDPKQQNKKHIQKDMQKQSKEIGKYTWKITGTLLHREDSYFRINDRQKKIGLRKKKDS
jgi:hypothetical protein